MYNAHYLLFILLLTISSNLSAAIWIRPFLNIVLLVLWLSLFLFIPVVFIEAVVMRDFFKNATFKKLLLVNATSNGLSIFIGLGLPIGIFIATLLINIDKIVKNLNQVVLLFLGIVILFLIFRLAYFVSVWIERQVITTWLGQTYDQETFTRAVKSANKASYIFLFIPFILAWYYFVTLAYYRGPL